MVSEAYAKLYRTEILIHLDLKRSIGNIMQILSKSSLFTLAILCSMMHGLVLVRYDATIFWKISTVSQLHPSTLVR